MAKLLECKEAIAKDGSTDNKLLLQCFRGKSMEQLMNTHPNFYEWKHLEQVKCKVFHQVPTRPRFGMLHHQSNCAQAELPMRSDQRQPNHDLRADERSHTVETKEVFLVLKDVKMTCKCLMTS